MQRPIFYAAIAFEVFTRLTLIGHVLESSRIFRITDVSFLKNKFYTAKLNRNMENVQMSPGYKLAFSSLLYSGGAATRNTVVSSSSTSSSAGWLEPRNIREVTRTKTYNMRKMTPMPHPKSWSCVSCETQHDLIDGRPAYRERKRRPCPPMVLAT